MTDTTDTTDPTAITGRQHPYEAGCHAALCWLNGKPSPQLPDFQEWVEITGRYGLGDEADLQARFSDGWTDTWNGAVRTCQ